MIETLYEPQSDGVQIEYVGRNNSVQGKLFKDTGCIYNGPSGTNKSLNLVLNHCGGLVSCSYTKRIFFKQRITRVEKRQRLKDDEDHLQFERCTT